MSRDLAGRAAALANGVAGDGPSPAAATVGQPEAPAAVSNGRVSRTPQPVPAELPDIEIDEPGEDGPPQVPVHVAWNRLMGDIRAIRKNRLYNAAGTRFNFRGVDDVVNVFAALVRKHGIVIWPVGVRPSYRDATTSKGSKMHECTVVVQWMVTGPTGDELPRLLESAGEALDSMDKATAKAQSVAWRVLLVTAAMVPTGDPDPDSVTGLERGEAPVRAPASYCTEILHPGTTRVRMAQIRRELIANRMMDAMVENEHGQPEAVGRMVDRVGRERFAPKPPVQQVPLSAGELASEDDGFPEPPPGVGVFPEEAARLAAGEVSP